MIRPRPIRLPPTRLRPIAFVVAAWILGATTSIGVGLLALTLVGEDLRGDASRPLTADAAVVVEQTPAATPTAPVPSPSTSTSATPATSATEPSPAGDDRRLSSAGGDVVARCSSAGVYLVYWSPAPGFRTDRVTRGPALIATLAFEGQNTEIKLRITCAAGIPQLQVVNDGPHDD